MAPTTRNSPAKTKTKTAADDADSSSAKEPSSSDEDDDEADANAGEELKDSDEEVEEVTPPPSKRKKKGTSTATPSSDNSRSKKKQKVAAAKPAAKATKAAANRKRGAGYTTEETMDLLDVIAEVLPIGPEEWDIVCQRHKDKYPEEDRDKDSLRRKFAKLHRAKIKTGDPHCPEDVRMAKRANREIEAKMGSTEEVDEEEIGFNNQPSAASNTSAAARRSSRSTTSLERLMADLPNGDESEPTPTPRRVGRPRHSKPESYDNIMSLFMQKMMQDDDRREERRQQQLVENEERKRQQRIENEERRQQNKRTDMLMMMGFGLIAKFVGSDVGASMQQAMFSDQQLPQSPQSPQPPQPPQAPDNEEENSEEEESNVEE